MAKKYHRSKSGTGGQHSFARIPTTPIQRSQFDRSYTYSTAGNAGRLYPVMVQEALPGDTMNVNTIAFCRFNTLLFPIFTNVYLDVQFFSIPMRLIWDNWEKFCGAQDDPGDSTSFNIPKVDSGATGHAYNTLYDYMGVPPKVNDLVHSNLPARAYNLVFNQWYRAQELQDSVVVDRDDGPDDPADYVILRRGKRHDYFTSCLTAPQRGDSVVLPIGTDAPVISDGDGVPLFDGTTMSAQPLKTSNGLINTNWGATDTANAQATWNATKLVADLENATGATINQLRQSFAIQRLLERDARGGTRYPEVLQSHFKVSIPDAQWRPEYLGGGTVPVVMQQVAQTSATGNVGDLSGFGTALGTAGFTHSFVEHCIVLGIASIRADLVYQQGLDRMWSRDTRWDFYWPELANIGEQAVLNKEIYAVGSATPGQDDLVFGYQERWAEYRYSPSMVTANMRSAYPTSLDAWHLAQDFAALPVLGSDFIEEDPPTSRVVAAPSEPAFRMDFYHGMKHARPMPTYSVPGMGNRF